jgi:hypothetical protein
MVNGNAITELTQTDVNRAIQYLDDNDTEKMTPTIEGKMCALVKPTLIDLELAA